MADLKQITLNFDEISGPPAAETAPPAPAPPPAKKRGRRPNPVPLVPKQPGRRGRISLQEPAAADDLPEIPEDAVLFQKSYYSIGQVSTMFHLNPSLIRLWANEFEPFLDPKKNKKGDRYFRPEDVKTLVLIHHLVRQRKFTMEGAKDYLKNNKAAGLRFSVIESMQQIKSFLLELKASL